MEEPPKIERIISSQGISLSDTASILNAYLCNIEHDQYYGLAGSAAVAATTAATTITIEGDSSETPRNKSRQEREEEALIAQMDQLTNSKSSSTGRMISDDIYERLKLIAQSICAEAEGKSLSASSRIMSENSTLHPGGGADSNMDSNDTIAQGADEFLAELDEAYRLEQEEEQRRQEKQIHVARSNQTKKDKKKEKKAKKAAKKAKKEAKRKSLPTQTL